jgi:hypothetical protein
LFTGDSKRHVREGFGREASISLQRLREGNLEGGSHTKDSKGHVIEGAGKEAFLFTGAP